MLSDSDKWAVALEPRVLCTVLTMSSVASLAAVTDSTRTSGTTVVNQDSEEIWGITWRAHTHTHKHTMRQVPVLDITLTSSTSCWVSARFHCDKQHLLKKIASQLPHWPASCCYRLITRSAQMLVLTSACVPAKCGRWSLPEAPAERGSRHWRSSGTVQTGSAVGRWRSCTLRSWWC